MLRKITGTLAAIMALTACGGNSSPTENKASPPAPASTAAVQVRDDFFDPPSVQVPAGEAVEWTLTGQMTNHTVTDEGGAFDSGFLSHAGATFSHTFTMADKGKTFHYECRTHAALGMKGTVTVQ